MAIGTTSSYTAGQIMDFSAALLNDPAKTDYTYDVLNKFLTMAYYELVDYQIDRQQPPVVETSSSPIVVPVGTVGIYQAQSLNTPNYPGDLSEIQEIGERLAGTKDLFVPMQRVDHLGYIGPATDRLRYWTWAYETIKFNVEGATTAREIELKYLRGFPANFIPPSDHIVAGHNTHTFLIYKTAALAAMFIGENAERASVLEAHALRAIEIMESIDNKGRQQIMTRHRPFRAAWKMRGGF